MISYRHFLSSGAFLEGLASNWQAAVLQLGSLIVFSAFLYQRGAPHSRDPAGVRQNTAAQYAGTSVWFYRYSLSLAFLLLFVLALSLHIVFGTRGYNEERELDGPVPDLDRGISAFSQILVDDPANLAGGISGDRDLCRAHHLSPSGGGAGIEAGRVAKRNNWRGEQVIGAPQRIAEGSARAGQGRT